ncbi:MAG: competence/damage-inducible protein A [Pseudomonadota bacterium]
MQKTYTAALIIVGNEILSGRTQDKNTAWLAEQLNQRGIAMREVRVIPDIQEVIVKTVNEMREQVNYVFTTGGIGPTHDDITAESVAKAFGVELELNNSAYNMLLDYYQDEAEITEARKKMAMIPVGASLIGNPVSGAPGFILGNVHVMAGVPKIMQGMFEGLVCNLAEGAVTHSQSVSCNLQESQLAPGLSDIQDKHAHVDIGSYPNYRTNGGGVSVVVRATDKEAVKAAGAEVVKLIQSLGQEPTAVTYLD